MHFAVFPLLVLLAACPAGAPDDFASRQQIIEAAARCGIDNFEPTRAGAEWAALVSPNEPDAEAKGDCIYADLQSQGWRVTR